MGLNSLIFPSSQHGDSFLAKDHSVTPPATIFNRLLPNITSAEETSSARQTMDPEVENIFGSTEATEGSKSGIALSNTRTRPPHSGFVQVRF
jgi:hypothetical protein